MEIKNLSKNFGVEINNFDCSKEINNYEIEFLRNTMQNKHFICFKNQNLDGNNLAQFTKNFGDISFESIFS